MGQSWGLSWGLPTLRLCGGYISCRPEVWVSPGTLGLKAVLG